LDLPELRSEFRAVRIVVYGKSAERIGSGYRMVFWITGDGRRTAVFTTTGEYYVLQNNSFDVDKVHGAVETRIEDGRVKYLMDDVWCDLGAWTTEGVKESDLAVAEAYKIYVTNEVDEVAKEPLDSFWLDGGSL